MKSGWVLNYADNVREIITEEQYKSFNETWRQEYINDGHLISEEYWFDIEKAKQKYKNSIIYTANDCEAIMSGATIRMKELKSGELKDILMDKYNLAKALKELILNESMTVIGLE